MGVENELVHRPSEMYVKSRHSRVVDFWLVEKLYQHYKGVR